METCSVCLEAVKCSERPESKASMEHAKSLPKQVETEVVQVMAEMAWAVSKEVAHDGIPSEGKAGASHEKRVLIRTSVHSSTSDGEYRKSPTSV